MLCRRIDELLAGQLPLPPDCPPALESHAQRIAAQLLAHERVGTPASSANRGRDVQHVDVDSLELIRPRSVGVEHVGLWAMDQLGLRTLFDELGLGASMGAAAVGSIIARMARPGSERAARRWLGERSALGELLGVEFATMGPMRLYRASDALMAHRAAIEHHLFDRAMGLFDLRPTVTLYDLTNTYFEGAAPAQGAARALQGQAYRLPAAHPGAGARRQRIRPPLASLPQRRLATLWCAIQSGSSSNPSPGSAGARTMPSPSGSG